jgi:ankyrin repeat protein
MRLSIDGASLPPLHRAAFEADLATLLRLLEGHADPNEPGYVRDEYDGLPSPGYIATPLMLAAASSRRNAADAIRILLNAGADPRTSSTRGDSALWFAAYAGNTRGMRGLLEHGAPPDLPSANGATAICEAAASGNVDGIRLLFHFGASPHPVAKDEEDDPVEPTYPHRIPLFAAAKGGRAECVRLLIDAGARVRTLDICGRTALMYASTPEVVRVWLEAGCALDERDAYGFDATNHAAENGHREVLFALVRAGADIHALNKFGMTRLLQYCSSLNVSGDMVRALIEAGADIHATWFRGRTALHEAAQLFGGDRRGKLREVIIALVEAGLDVNVRDDSFSTPLHYAVGEEGLDLGAVQTLLELGADPALKNDYGQIPLDLAPDHVRRWKRILAEDRPSVFAGLEIP